MRKHDRVCVEVAKIHSIDHWESAQAHGGFQQIFGSQAKAYLHEFSLGIKHLITIKEKRNLNFISEFSSKISKDEVPIVFIIKVEEITGRMRSH
jgi:nitroimidazol reductase NimA-like FMN-containing flavoprotein (pyridoxamine 5'-phosphate oxidase superfamily)